MIPCEKCITLAICKNQAIGNNKVSFNLNSLVSKCSIFKEYCYREDCFIKDVVSRWALDTYHEAYYKMIKFFVKGYEHKLSTYQRQRYQIE